MSGAPKPRMHGVDHVHGGPDPIRVAWEATDEGGGPGGGTGGLGVMPYSYPGVLAVGNGTLPWEALDAGDVELVHARVGTAPTGAALGVRVKKNGTSIGTLTIAAAATSSSFVPASPAFAAGDVFTVDVTSVGSTVPGSDLVVQLKIGGA